MPLSTTMLDDDAAFMVADLPQSVTIDGVAYACIATDGKDNPATLGIAGVFNDFEVALIVRTALFTTLPAQNDLVTYAGKSLRILQTESSVDGVTVTLYCGDLTK